MTTRKELIERIQAMQLGTQEMLDAAADDAMLIPFGVLFVSVTGNAVWREKDYMEDSFSVFMVGEPLKLYHKASELRPMFEE